MLSVLDRIYVRHSNNIVFGAVSWAKNVSIGSLDNVCRRGRALVLDLLKFALMDFAKFAAII